jgi:hypothetical protein
VVITDERGTASVFFLARQNWEFLRNCGGTPSARQNGIGTRSTNAAGGLVGG